VSDRDFRAEVIEALRAGVGIVRDARLPKPLQPVAYDRVLQLLLAPEVVRAPPPPEPDGVWRCPECGGRPQALLDPRSGDTTYGCARGHALVTPPGDAKLRA
jgi:hypothetical protein